jgi:hypothetical protein
MQKLRRLNFFDRNVVRQQQPGSSAAAEAHPGIQNLNIVCATGSASEIWLGDARGCIHRLDRAYNLLTFCAFDQTVYSLKLLEKVNLLIAVG